MKYVYLKLISDSTVLKIIEVLYADTPNALHLNLDIYCSHQSMTLDKGIKLDDLKKNQLAHD